VEMDHSRDKGCFRVTYMHIDAQCPEYCSNEPDAPGEEGMPNSYFEEQCECGDVHDGSGHDSEASYRNAGCVFNVEPHWQREAQLPRTLTHDGGDDDIDWWSDDEDINLTVLERTDGKVFLVDKNSENE
jgi:hypothetical protein